jgi:hypothetical protein
MKSDIGIVSEIGLALAKLNEGEYYEYPEDISPDRINRVLNIMKESEDREISITEDINGHDMDWSLIDNIIYMNCQYFVWGCVTSGSLMFRKK